MKYKGNNKKQIRQIMLIFHYLCVMNAFIQLTDVLPRVPDVAFEKPFSFTMNKGDVWTFYGPNGSGKTLLSEVIGGRYGIASGCIDYPFMEEEKAKTTAFIYPRQFIKTIHFQSTYSFSDFRDAYYQQRFNVYEVEWYPTVQELLQPCSDTAWVNWVVEVFKLEPLLLHRLITLSSGQLRRLLIAKALLEKPRMMVFDNPFIGLDQETRLLMEEVFALLAKQGTQLLFLVADARDVPACTTHLLHVDKCAPVYAGKVADYVIPAVETPRLPNQFVFDYMELGNEDYQNVVAMKQVCIQYDGLVFQPDITWKIQKGEKWALLGPNGSGKSTLLSYIFADNPQAYSLPIWLFDRKRGSGESIWEIKKRIGYTSSEMHLYYRENVPCLKVVQSGFFDSVGLYKTCTEEQYRRALLLMQEMGIDALAQKPFLRVSAGEQRMVLFARALIKNPQLLILDEPFHGMDVANKSKCLKMIERFGAQADKSLIFVTHYKNEIPACVQQVYTLQAPSFLQSKA